jgi:PAS domain S-box-containing protein
MCNGRVVLVVDDDQGILEYYQKILSPPDNDLDILGGDHKDNGDSLQIRPFLHPSELLEFCRSEMAHSRQFPLAIVDMRMPEKNGLETAEALRQIDPDINIVICTAYSDFTTDELQRRLNERVFLVHKPFAVEEFTLLINTILREWEGNRALAESEKKYRRLIENSNDIIYTITENGIFTFVSNAWTTLLGHPATQVVGESLDQFVYPDDLPDYIAYVKQVVETGEQSNGIEYRMCHTDASLRWFNSRLVALMDESGTVIGLEGTARDITSQKWAKEEMEQQAGLISSLLDSIPDIIFFKDTDGVYIGCNPPFAEFVGQPRDNIVGKTDYDLFDKEVADSFREHDLNMLKLQESQRNEESITYPDGRIIQIDTLKTPYWGPDGTLIGVLGISRDITARKKTEEALRDSEVNFRTFFESMTDIIMVGTPDGHLLFTNSAVTTTLGYSADDLANMNILDLHPSDRLKEAEDIFTAMFKGERDTCPLPLARKDGILVPVETRVWFGRWNGTDCIFGISKNLTAEQEAQQRFERLFQNNPTPMALSTLPDRTLVDVNTAFLNTLGYTRNEVIGKTTSDLGLFPNQDQQDQVADVLNIIGSISDSELQVKCKNGTILDGLFSGEIINNQGCKYLLTVMIDITERKQAEDKLRQASTRLSLAARAGGVGVWDLDIVNNILIWDDQMFSLYGISWENFSGAYEAWQNGLHPEDSIQGDLEIKKAISGEKEFDTEFRVVWPDGTIRNIRALGLVQRDDAGQALRMIGTNWDITDRMRVEEDLIESNRKLEETTRRAESANAAKSDFLANMSHEIRTPMNGVIGMTGLLLDTELTSEQRHYAESVNNSSELLLALLNDILDFSKMEAGKLEMETLNFNLCSLLDDFTSIMCLSASDKGLEFTCDTAPELPTLLCGDPGRLRQILANLANNAVKFTHKGTIAVNVSLLSETETEAFLHFSVKDTGIGVPADKQNTLFQKFTQADASTTRHYGGTGLGLAISKQLVERMDGEIGIVSKEGCGSEFWFNIRMCKQGQSTCTDLPSTPFDATSNCRTCDLSRSTVRILLAEDNIINQQVALIILKKMGVHADGVANGIEAVRSLETINYDLVLMDVQMPEMDGYEAAQQIRSPQSAVKNHYIPIIAMTGNALQGDREKCLQAGMNDYVSKPVDPQALSEVLDRWLPKGTVE